MGYGVFLIHVLVPNTLRTGALEFLICSHSFLGININPAWGAFVLFIITASLSIIIVSILNRIPIIKKLV